MSLVLSLFPGIGLLDMAFEDEGFCIVRGPDLLWGGDIKRFHPPAGKFDGVIGGPPCQAFSRLRFVNPKAGQKHGNLVPEFERCVREAAPDWFLMENVEGAPEPDVPGYRVRSTMVRDVWVGGVTDRLRRFSFGSGDGASLAVEQLALHIADPEHSALASGGGRPLPVVLMQNGKRKRTAVKNLGYKSAGALAHHIRKQGLPPDFLDEAPFTVDGKLQVIGNGVPLHMGRAVAKAVRRALAETEVAA